MKLLHYILPWALVMSTPLWNQRPAQTIKYNREHSTAVYVPLFVNIFKAKKFQGRLPCLMPGRIRYKNGDCYLFNKLPEKPTWLRSPPH